MAHLNLNQHNKDFTVIPRPPLKSEWIDLNRIWNLQGTQEKLLLIPRSHYVIFLHSVPQRKCKSISCYWGLCCARLARRDSRGWPSFRICVTLLALSRPSSLFSRAASAWVPGEHGGLPDVLETQKQHHHSLQPYATATVRLRPVLEGRQIRVDALQRNALRRGTLD